MARIRTVKPEFWSHEVLSALPEATHMLAAALLNHADDEGYFNAHPGLVKAACSPLREPSVSIHDSLKSLQEVGYLAICTGSDGKTYGFIVKFSEHQKVNRPTPSKIKGLCNFTEYSLSPQVHINEGSLPERKGKEQGKEQGDTGAPAPSPDGEKKSKAKKITLREYLDDRKAKNLSVFDNDGVFEKYAESISLPMEFVYLAWERFKEVHTRGSRATVKQASWSLTFLNCLKDNWYKFWWAGPEGFELTTAGIQAKREREAADEHSRRLQHSSTEGAAAQH